MLRLGAFPVTRNLQNYVSEIRQTHAVVEPWPRWRDPAHRLTHLFRAEPAVFCAALLAESPLAATGGWRQYFVQQELIAAEKADAGQIAAILEEIADATPLFVGNSLAIRQLDSLSGSGEKPFTFTATGAPAVSTGTFRLPWELLRFMAMSLHCSVI